MNWLAFQVLLTQKPLRSFRSSPKPPALVGRLRATQAPTRHRGTRPYSENPALRLNQAPLVCSERAEVHDLAERAFAFVLEHVVRRRGRVILVVLRDVGRPQQGRVDFDADVRPVVAWVVEMETIEWPEGYPKSGLLCLLDQERELAHAVNGLAANGAPVADSICRKRLTSRRMQRALSCAKEVAEAA